MSNNDSQQIVNKAWNFAHVLRDDGLTVADNVVDRGLLRATRLRQRN